MHFLSCITHIHAQAAAGDILVKIQDINEQSLGEWGILNVFIPLAPLVLSPSSTTVDINSQHLCVDCRWRTRPALQGKVPCAPSALAGSRALFHVLELKGLLFTLDMEL